MLWKWKNRSKKKCPQSEKKVVEVKIIVDRSKYFVAGNVTPQSHRIVDKVVRDCFQKIQVFDVNGN